MGCIKLIFRIIVLILALIGLMAVVKFDYEGAIDNFRNPTRESTLKSAECFGDFSNLDSDYKIRKPFGKKIIITHSPSSQSMIFFTTKDSSITQKDFKDKKVDEILEEFLGKIDNKYIGMDEFKITGRGSVLASSREVGYITFSAKVKNLPLEKISGIFGAYEHKGEVKYFLSARKNDKFSKKIGLEILQTMKIN